MSEGQALFAVLRQSAAAVAADAIERLVQEASDRNLNRINVLELAARLGMDEDG